jgi:hypothetical protein
METKIKFKNLHLAVCSIVVIIVGLIYGICPEKILPLFLDIKVESIDLKNFFRAIMGLYLALATYWLIGAFKPKYWFTATVVCTMFMGGLTVGRILSIIVDGIPSVAFIMGLVLESFSMIWGLINLKQFNNNTKTV